jgi:uncharacterized protein DUF3179
MVSKMASPLAPRYWTQSALNCAAVLVLAFSAQPVSTPTPTTVADSAPAREPRIADPPAPSRDEWKTDVTKAIVPLSEISSGGPPRDGIPPIDQPRFIRTDEAGSWLKDDEPVVAFELNGETRAYPMQILIWHEIVNDTVGGLPVMITFCPLRNTAIAFDRRVDGQALRFGTTGNLRRSDLVMWSDDPGETWWQQITGQALVGGLVGHQLTMLPAEIVSFRDFKSAFPNGQVLSRDTGVARRYGWNPYVGYDDINSTPILYSGPATDGRLLPKERVVTIELNGDAAAYPFSQLMTVHVANDTVGGTPVVVFHQSGTRSALDTVLIETSRDIGAATVFEASIDGQRLTFNPAANGFEDAQTGSTWDILGRAISGPLAGQRLQSIVSANHFWFAWVVFKPDTRVWAP